MSWPFGKKAGNRKHSKIDSLPPEMKATVEEMILDGIGAALDALQKDSGYLFESAETPPPYAAGTGSGTVSRADKADDGVETAFAALNPKLKF